MGFFDAIARFDKKYKMSEPCFEWTMEKRIEIPASQAESNQRIEQLEYEVRQLRKQLETKRLKAIEIEGRRID